MNPIEKFHEDRSAAFAAEDPMAAVCTVANVDHEGQVQIRTLVLRNVGDDLAIFIIATLSLIHISEPTRPSKSSRMPSSA